MTVKGEDAPDPLPLGVSRVSSASPFYKYSCAPASHQNFGPRPLRLQVNLVMNAA